MEQAILEFNLTENIILEDFYTKSNSEVISHLNNWINSDKEPIPIYLWGSNYSGKTQILKSACESLIRKGLKVGWLDANMWDISDFEDSWSAIIMDDINLYDKKQQSYAFNWFINSITPNIGTQRFILSSGDSSPNNLKIRKDLKTRLSWGNIFDIKTPDNEECKEILKIKASQRGIELKSEVVDYIFNHFSRDLNSLMPLLKMLDKFALSNKRNITVPLLKEMLNYE